MITPPPIADRVSALHRCVLCALTVAVCTSIISAQVSSRVTWKRLLDRDDANRNGRIEAGEYSGSTRSFARFDKDDSGSLSEDELGVRLDARPTTTASAPISRRAARAEARQADAMSQLKLRQAALLMFQVDEFDDDARTLTRDEFLRGWSAHDIDRDTRLTLRELTAAPSEGRRRLTGLAAEAYAELLHEAIDTNEDGYADRVEGLRWFDERATGLRNDELTIDTLDDDRSAIVRGAYDEVSTSRSAPSRDDQLAATREDDITPVERPQRPAREDDIASATPVRPTPARVALAKERETTPTDVARAPQRTEVRDGTPTPAPAARVDDSAAVATVTRPVSAGRGRETVAATRGAAGRDEAEGTARPVVSPRAGASDTASETEKQVTRGDLTTSLRDKTEKQRTHAAEPERTDEQAERVVQPKPRVEPKKQPKNQPKAKGSAKSGDKKDGKKKKDAAATTSTKPRGKARTDDSPAEQKSADAEEQPASTEEAPRTKRAKLKKDR